MARGLASGMIWGAMTSIVGAGALSLAVGLPSAPERMDAAPIAEASPSPTPEAASSVATGADRTITERTGADPAVPTAPAPTPRPGSAVVTAAPAVPGTVEAAPAAPLTATDPAPQPQTAAPVTAPDVPSPTPADPPVGTAATPGDVGAPRDETAQAAAPAAPVAPVTDPSPPVQATAPQPVTPDAASPVPAEPRAAEAVPAANSPAIAAIAPENGAAATPETAGAPDAGDVDVSPAAEAPEAAETPGSDIAALPQTRALGVPGIGTPAVPLTERDKPAVTAGPKAIDTFAAPFDNPGGKPRMAIVLIDRGDSPVGLEALRAFPYPLSFAVDPSRRDATAAMARYRAAGFEVLALADLPEAATAPDVEQALAAILTTLPEAVAVMEGDRSGVQATKEAADQVTAMLAASGHGAVFLPKGLDTARKLAEKAGVPAATIFRDFDGEGQDPGTIRRFLDQAAFKAGQDAIGVIMLGRLRPETISALLLWGLQDRAERVALAPVSAVLRGE